MDSLAVVSLKLELPARDVGVVAHCSQRVDGESTDERTVLLFLSWSLGPTVCLNMTKWVAVSSHLHPTGRSEKNTRIVSWKVGSIVLPFLLPLKDIQVALSTLTLSLTNTSHYFKMSQQAQMPQFDEATRVRTPLPLLFPLAAGSH